MQKLYGCQEVWCYLLYFDYRINQVECHHKNTIMKTTYQGRNLLFKRKNPKIISKIQFFDICLKCKFYQNLIRFVIVHRISVDLQER